MPPRPSTPFHRRPRPLAGLLAGVCFLGGCAVNPATGERQLSLVSENQEIEMGLAADTQIVASMGLDPDSGRQRYVRQVGLRLAHVSERPNLPWTFRVIDDPVVNAFAIPGGHVYVTRGILADLNNEAELAAVMGHEIGHVTARHSVSQMSRAELAQLGLVVGSVLSSDVQRYAGVASQGLGLLFLKYSRDDESQADRLGFRYMRRAGYDARQMPDVFTLLDRVSKASGGDRIPDWLSTHPNPTNRRGAIERDIAATSPESLGTVVDRDSYLRHIDGIVYGDNPRDGYFKGNEFLQPALRFRVTFPADWQTQNQPQAVLAASPAKDAMMQLSLARQGTPETAAQAFFGQQGVSGFAGPATVHGLTAAGGGFYAVSSDSTRLAGRALFVAYEGRVYQLLAYAVAASWPSYAGTVDPSLFSFERLTDPAVLGVQPWRVQLVTVPQAMTVAAFARRYPGPVPAATVALVNNVDPDARFAAGTLVKRIAGEPLP